MAWPRPPQVLVEAVKRAGAVVGLVAVGPLLLAAPVVVVAAAQAATACSTGGLPAVDAAAVARQVEAVLASDGGGGDVAVPGWDDPAEQVPHARTIQATGVAQGVPARGQVVALAAALQESRLRNLAFGDRDSLGLFQQRPSQGWGPPWQILDPVYAATRFYERLLAVDGWEQLTVAQAAQAVQGSALPDAYARWEPLAVALQEALAPSESAAGDDSSDGDMTGSEGLASGGAGGLGGCTGAGGDGSGFGSIPPGVLPDGYQIPAAAPAKVRTAIRWALGQLGTPYQWGGTCMEPHGPDPMGRCDCSSLMQQSYAAAGVEISRTTYTQVEDGRSARMGALRPGDLLFTRGSAAAPEHVGMLIGSGLVVHAPRPGAVVRIGTLADWRADVLAARRIVS